jgi:hypothetical protein
MRIIVGASLIVIASLGASLKGQQPEPPSSLERLRLALDHQPQLTAPAFLPWTQPTPTRLGFLTLVPPGPNGQIVRVSIPVGGLAMRAVHAVSSAQHRRADRRADQRVQRSIREFRAQPSAQ